MSNENSRIDYESGVTPFAMSALIDSGDQKKFTSQAALFSEASGNAPDVRPDGLLTGGVVAVAVSGSNNVVDVAALTCFLAGVNTAVGAGTDTAITRAATNVANINSITITSAGAIAVVAGADSLDTTFSEVRGAAGAPPFIPVGSIEIAQIRVTSNVAAPIAAGEIFRTIGTHLEKSDFPGLTIHNANAEVNFDSALPTIHTGSLPRGVYAAYADPIFTELPFANDFVPAETLHSSSSEQVYGATVGTSSSSLNQATFTAILKDGITDGVLSRKNETLWFRFFQDKFKAAHILTQGKFGIARSFGASDNPRFSCTVSPEVSSVDRAA